MSTNGSSTSPRNLGHDVLEMNLPTLPAFLNSSEGHLLRFALRDNRIHGCEDPLALVGRDKIGVFGAPSTSVTLFETGLRISPIE
jgi:hypothetical protein